MGCGSILLAIVCLIIQAIIFIFVIVGTPIDAFRSKTQPVLGFRSCYSMWGLKRCGNHGVNSRGLPYKGFPCKKTRDTMNAAAAFAIFSIFLTLIAMIMSILLVVKVCGKFLAIPFAVICAITILIVWACQAGAYYQNCGAGIKIKDTHNYAGSFGLMVTAWCLQMVNIVLMCFT